MSKRALFIIALDDGPKISTQEEQLREVTRHFGISLDQDRLMSRCPKCNVSSFRLVSKENVAARVPIKVFDLVDEFFECGECLQVFWMVSVTLHMT